MRKDLKDKTKIRHIKKVSSDFYGQCKLNELPSHGRIYFKIVKKDGSLSKKIYIKDKDSYNRATRKYYVCSVDDVYGSGRSLSGKTKVSTAFDY